MEQIDILTLIYASIDETNRQLPVDGRLEKSPDTLLLGDGSQLDSLSLITFVVAFEEALEQTHGARYNLLDEGFLGNPEGPLKSVRTLATFVEQMRG